MLVDKYNKVCDHEITKNARHGRVYDLSRTIVGYIAWARGINPKQANRIEEWLMKYPGVNRACREIYRDDSV